MFISFTPYAVASSKSPFKSSYDKSCNNAEISDPAGRYMNQPEKEHSFHIDELMTGYNGRYDSCSQDLAMVVDDESNGSPNTLKVIVHMSGVGFACVYSERQDLGCYEADDAGTLVFVFSEGSVEAGENFTACFKDRENEPYYKCETTENGPGSDPEHVYSRIPK
jgi:hypothetical protein